MAIDVNPKWKLHQKSLNSFISRKIKQKKQQPYSHHLMVLNLEKDFASKAL